jgi:hypothetical protein
MPEGGTQLGRAAVFVLLVGAIAAGKSKCLPRLLMHATQSRNATFAIWRVVFSVFIKTRCQSRSVMVA